MLNSTTLSHEFKEMFDDVLPDAIEAALNSLSEYKSSALEKKNKEFADLLTEMVSKPLSERMAASIDHYLKSACFYGTIMTAGSPVAQTAVIAPGMSCGMATAGKVPNTIGIM